MARCSVQTELSATLHFRAIAVLRSIMQTLNSCTEFTDRKGIIFPKWLSFLWKAEGELSTRVAQRQAELLRVRAVASISAGDRNNGIEGTLSKLDDTKLWDTLEGRDGIQRDLDRLESWECVTLTKSIKAKCKVLQGCSAWRREAPGRLSSFRAPSSAQRGPREMERDFGQGPVGTG